MGLRTLQRAAARCGAVGRRQGPISEILDAHIFGFGGLPMPTGFARRLAWLSSVVLLFGESAVSTAARPVTHRMPSFAERQRGWMARDANPKHAWLYVNGNNNIVEVYDLDARPGPRLIGTIADGLNNLESMTVDQKGTLYVANDTTPFVTIYPA